jgi:hypothetical protein
MSKIQNLKKNKPQHKSMEMNPSIHQLTMQNVRWTRVEDNKMREHKLKLTGCRNYLTGQRKEDVFVSKDKNRTHPANTRLFDETTSGAKAA